MTLHQKLNNTNPTKQTCKQIKFLQPRAFPISHFSYPKDTMPPLLGFFVNQSEFRFLIANKNLFLILSCVAESKIFSIFGSFLFNTFY